MAHVIYNPNTYRIFTFPNGNKAVFDNERVAKGQLMKLTNKGVLNADWKVESYDTFTKNEPMVKVKNLMSGKDVMIRKSEVGGCCDPSTERYWTM